MKINWKLLSRTRGYKSLKAAYVRDVQESSKRNRPLRDKEEYLKKFNWVISRAKHYAHYTGRCVGIILNEWEEKRTYYWLNFYQDCNQPKLHPRVLNEIGINGVRDYHKGSFFQGKAKHYVNDFIQREHRDSSTKTKKRWTTVMKNRRRPSL